MLNTIEFNNPFTVNPDRSISFPDNVYAPGVEHCPINDVLIDSDKWHAFSVGYTGQHGYSGAVRHASEQLSGALESDILTTPGTYVITAVEAPCSEDDPCFADDYAYCVLNGCSADPAGWSVLKLNEGA